MSILLYIKSMLLYITIIYNMFRALFEFFNTNILSVCYDIKTNTLYERENEITLNKYKKNDDIKTKKNNNDINDINNDNDNINIYDNINILFKNYYDNRDENVKENYNINSNDNNDINTDTDTDTDIYDIISNEEIKESTF